jgi:lipoprotein-anchoring transpeptidase ErfK/SrfK
MDRCALIYRVAPPVDLTLRILRRTLVPLSVVVLVVTGPVVVRPAGAPGAPAAVSIPPATTTTVPRPTPVVPVSTPLATPEGVIATFDAPAGEQVGTVGLWYGYPMTMPIVQTRGDWLQIRLPERPNGSTAWVRRDDVVTSSSPYRIVISLAETKLTVYEDGFALFTAPVGIGKESTPTPTGSFFVAVIEEPGPAGYGPLVLDTNGHSEAIESWEGSGDAITAIHGPISASSDAQIGTTGTRISNGCIRMHEADQVKLGIITLGTPVDIVS